VCAQSLADALIANISWYLERIALLFVILPLVRSSILCPILTPIIAREQWNLSATIVVNSKGSAVTKFSGTASYDMALVFDFDLLRGTLDLWRLRLWSFSFILLFIGSLFIYLIKHSWIHCQWYIENFHLSIYQCISMYIFFLCTCN